MSRILVISYSQAGETAEVARLFAAELVAAGAEVLVESLSPAVAYPFPWKSVRRFFDEMPNSILGITPPIKSPVFDPSARFDLIVLCYPVWFLSPAPVIQAFFKCAHARTLRDTDVITISVSRAMWQRASVAMRRLLAAAGARQIDNVVVTHQGSAIATLVSTPRTLLFGKRDRLLSVFPRAGVAYADLRRVSHLGSVVARQLAAARASGASFLRGEPAVTVNRWLAVPELLAWYCFYASAKLIDALGRLHPVLRAVGVVGFAVFLVILIIVGLPLTYLATLLLAPLIKPRLDAYVARLAAPGGAAGTGGPLPAPRKSRVEEIHR